MSNIMNSSSNDNNIRTSKRTNQKIIDASCKLFNQYGYHGTSIAMIADTCQLKKASVFYHFSKKEDISLAVISRIYQDCDTNIFSVADDNVFEPEEKLEAFIKATEDYILNSKYAATIASLSGEVEGMPLSIRQAIRLFIDTWQESIITLLYPIHGMHKAKRIARKSLSYIHGAILMKKVTDDDKYILQTVKYLGLLWTFGLSAG